MPADDQLESLAHGSQLGIVQPVLGERRSVARGEQELVALTKRKAELLGDAQQQVAPRLGAGAPHGPATAARERRSTSARSALRFPRLAGLAGLASFDLIIIAAFVAPPLWNAPGTGASGARVSAYAQHYASRSTAALLIYSIAMGLFLCFAAGLWAWLRG